MEFPAVMADTTASKVQFAAISDTSTVIPGRGLVDWEFVSPAEPPMEWGAILVGVCVMQPRVAWLEYCEELIRGLRAARWPEYLPEETSTGPSPLKILIHHELKLLESFASLEPDWDSYGAAQITEKAISTTKRLVMAVAEEFGDLLGEGVRPYAVAPVADGGVYVEWRGSGGQLQVWVGPRGSLSYLLIPRSGICREPREQDETSLKEVLNAATGVFAPQECT